MTREEYLKFKELVKRLEQTGDIRFDNAGNVQTDIVKEEELNKEIGLGLGYSMKKFLYDIHKSDDYKDMDRRVKFAFADVDNNIKGFVKKVAAMEDTFKKASNGKGFEMKDIYTEIELNDGADYSKDKATLEDYKKKLAAARTMFNSDAYDKLQEAVDKAITDMDKCSNTNEYVAIMDSLKDASKAYLAHKSKDGVKKNAMDKVGVAFDLQDFANQSTFSAFKKDFEARKKKTPEEVFYSRFDFTCEQLKRIYPDKAKAIDEIGGKGSNEYDVKMMASRLGYVAELKDNPDYTEEEHKKKTGNILAANVIMYELENSNGKRTPLLDSIFNTENTTERYASFLDGITKNYAIHIMDYFDDEKHQIKKVDDLLMNPESVVKSFRESQDMYRVNGDYDLLIKQTGAQEDIRAKEAQKAAEEEKVREERKKVELAELARKEKAAKIGEEYKRNLSNARALQWLADNVSDKSKQKEYRELAKISREKAMFGEDKKEKTVKPAEKSKENALGLE